MPRIQTGMTVPEIKTHAGYAGGKQQRKNLYSILANAAAA